MVRDFTSFLTKTNAMALAIGVIIGAATSKLVSAVADDVLMPVIGVILPSGGWREAKWVLSGENAIRYGHLLGTIIDFAIIAWIVFMVARWLVKPESSPPTKVCGECREVIPIDAKRCRACTTAV